MLHIFSENPINEKLCKSMKSFHNIYNNINKSFSSLSKLHLRKFPKFFARLPPVNPQKKTPNRPTKTFPWKSRQSPNCIYKIKIDLFKNSYQTVIYSFDPGFWHFQWIFINFYMLEIWCLQFLHGTNVLRMAFIYDYWMQFTFICFAYSEY